ncbi:MAG: phage scaffolding protein [Clostridium sp.]
MEVIMINEILTSCGIESEKASEIVKAMAEAKVYTTKLDNVDVRYNKLKEQNKELDSQVKEYSSQLEGLSKNNKDNQELIKQIEQLQLSNKQTQEAYDNKIKAMEFDYALDSALSMAKCKNKMALKALLDLESINYQEGKLEGLEGQINALKDTDSYLFEETTPTNTGGVGNFGRSKTSESNGNSQSMFMDSIKNNQIRK